MAAPLPPYRADHVGSLLRPESVLRARDEAAAGRITADAAASDRGRRHPRRREDAGGRRAAGRDRRRVPARLVAHGLHLPARRRRQVRRDAPHRDAQRQRGDRVRDGRAQDRQARSAEDDLRRRLHVPEGDDEAHAQADGAVAEHGALPRWSGGDRPCRVPHDGRVLGRPQRRVREGGRGSRRARVHLPAVRRHEPRLPERPRRARQARPREATTRSTSTSATSSRSTRRSPAGPPRCG